MLSPHDPPVEESAATDGNQTMLTSLVTVFQIYNHLTVKIPSDGDAKHDKEAFLINPFGLRCEALPLRLRLFVHLKAITG